MSDFEFVRQPWNLPAASQEPGSFWEHAAAHRAVVTQIIGDAARGISGGRLAVLGAGVCNDLSLREIADRYAEVHLFDIDAGLCRGGVEKQGMTGDSRIVVHGGDLTGVQPLVEGWKSTPPDTGLIDTVIRNLKDFRLAEFSGRFDVVISTCLLSQLMKHVIECLPEGSPRLVELLQAVRSGHLLQMIDLCRSRGKAVLVFDFVSSESIPGLASTRPEDLLALAQKAVAEQNFFHGMNPGIIDRIFKEDPEIAPLVSDVVSTMPWVWDSKERQYLVLAIQCTKR